MADIELIDVSCRDGNQSNWSATGLSASQIVAIAPVLDRVGFRALDFASSTAMGVSVRTFREDPWEKNRRFRAMAPNTPLQLIGTGLRFISWETQDADFMRLVYRRMVASGVTRFAVLDPMLDIEAMRETARIIREEGGTEIVAALTYTVSAVHDDACYARLAADVAACADMDRAYIKDPAGLLTPERARTLIPAIVGNLGGKALELHSHCTIGLAPYTYMTAADLGVSALHVALGPLASGSSLPSATRVVANLREHGHRVDIGDHALRVAADYFTRLAEAEGLPAGQPQDYDAAFLRHQVAGGVMTTTRRQLEEIKLGHRFDDVMAEVDRVRAELGYPIMVTPFPQIVCTQALFNVIGKERYEQVPDQVIRYVLGLFGRSIARIDPDIKDRILATRRAREIMAEPPPPSLAELRRKIGPHLSDDEFLLRATMPADQVDAMLAAPQPSYRYNPDLAALLKVVEAAVQRGDGQPVRHLAPRFTMELEP
jgi:oxaloacetate decarboxylase (Na+ extruding) subunit alpha